MVDLPTVQPRIVTSEAPTSSVTRGDIQQNANLMAGAVEKTADAVMDISVEAAKKQATDDLLQQKVTRNADGSVGVADPSNAPLMFGRAGEAYNAAVKVGTVAQNGNVMSQELAQLHAKYPTDHEAFKAASDTFIQTHAQALGGPIGQAVMSEGRQLQTQHLNSIVNTAATNDVQNQKVSITQQIADQRDTLTGLARQPGGTDTPEFRQGIEKFNLLQDSLGANPLFKTPPEMIDREKKNTAAFLQGEALVAHVDNTFTKRGKVEAQKELQGLLTDPNLREVDRSRLYTQGLSRLGYLTADAKEKIDAGKKDVAELETNLAGNKIKAEDPAVAMATQAAVDRGDPQSAQRINAAAVVQRQMRGVQSLPDAVKNEVLGITHSPVVNQSVPPEGRALLDKIASTESAGRYNVRYGGKGDQTFQGYGDHPRIAEPITSGPDVGKTSSAAGRYQFIGSTWDAQAKKLGLKDFSPANQDAAAWDLAQTEYKTKTGKDLSQALRNGDSDVLPSLSGQWSSLPGGRQPAGGGGRMMAPAANGGPGFTYADVQRNPFLLSAYVRTLAADEDLRVQSAKQTATSIGKALDAGLIPSPQSVAEVRQAAQMYPQKMGPAGDELEGRLTGGQLAALPQEQHDQVIAAYKAASDGQDVHHQNIAAAALKQDTDQKQRLADHPYQEAETRGWIAQPAMPIDPGQPDGIPAALAQRAVLSARIGGMNHTPPPPLLDKDEMPKLHAALQGPQGGVLLAGISQALKPQEMDSLLEQKGFVDSVTGMMSSKDPSRMTQAMAFVDKYWRDNAANAETKFGAAAVTKLQAWQGLADSFSPTEMAERLNASDDPSTVAARKVAEKAANSETEKLTPADMAYKMGTSWGIPVLSSVANVVTGATPAVPFDSIKGGQMVADYKATYTALRTYGVDADKASDLAVKRLGTSWGVSAAAGNQVMKNPPERSYPQIGRSHDWIQSDLTAWIEGKAGKQFSAAHRSAEMVGMSGEDRNWSIAGMISDGQTQAEIVAGKPPSYQVAIKRRDGTLDIIPSRISFDPSQHIGEHETALRQRWRGPRAARDLQFQAGMPQP
jgi:muramidase (phage lysozyme)